MELDLKKYKNIKKCKLKIESSAIFFGANGSGKTNLMNNIHESLLELESTQEIMVTYIRAKRMYSEFSLNNIYDFISPKIEQMKDYEYLVMREYGLSNYEDYIKTIINLYFIAIKKLNIPNTIRDVLEIVFDYSVEEEIEIEDLSDGMKSVVFIVSQLLVIQFELDYMLKMKYISESEYNDYVNNVEKICLIDEIDLNIYDANIEKFYHYLVQNFKGWKFLITTHSPVLIYNIPKETELFSLKNGIPKKEKNYYSSPINEVLTDLFNVDVYNNEIRKLYNKLKSMAIHSLNSEKVPEKICEEFRLLETLYITENPILYKYYQIIETQIIEKNEV